MPDIKFQVGTIYFSDPIGLLRYLGIKDHYGATRHAFQHVMTGEVLHWTEHDIAANFNKENMGYHTNH